MIIKVKNFIENAIKNGYTGNLCKGWDWIKNNIEELDIIFKNKEYQGCNGMIYKCIPILEKITNITEKDNLSFIEKRVLETVWYINNEINGEKEKENKIKKLNEKGFYKIKSKKEYDKKKIEFIIDASEEIFGGIKKYTRKLYWSTIDNRLMAIPKKYRKRGYFIDNNNIYVQFL